MKAIRTKLRETFVLLFLMLVTLGNSHTVNADTGVDSESNFQKAKSEILANFVDASISEDTLYQYALQGMLAGLNKKHPEWNRMYTPVEYQQLQSELSGKIVCIGVEITLDSNTGTVLILEVIPGSPAEKAGIKSQDKIIQVDGKSVKGMSLSDCPAFLLIGLLTQPHSII